MKTDLDAFEPGSGDKVDSGTIAGYTSTDMFIQALKTVAKKGKSNITPENVQKAAATPDVEARGRGRAHEVPRLHREQRADVRVHLRERRHPVEHRGAVRLLGVALPGALTQVVRRLAVTTGTLSLSGWGGLIHR